MTYSPTITQGLLRKKAVYEPGTTALAGANLINEPPRVCETKVMLSYDYVNDYTDVMYLLNLYQSQLLSYPLKPSFFTLGLAAAGPPPLLMHESDKKYNLFISSPPPPPPPFYILHPPPPTPPPSGGWYRETIYNKRLTLLLNHRS